MRRVILDIDGVLVSTKKWVTRDGRLFGVHGNQTRQCGDGYNGRGYIHNSIRPYTPQLRHRLVANIFCVNPRPGYFTDVDHADGNILNNAADNLRFVSNQLNLLNRKSKTCKPKSGNQNVYHVQITFCYKNHHITNVETEQEALDLKDKLRRKLFNLLYDYETRPMMYPRPETWKIGKHEIYFS